MALLLAIDPGVRQCGAALFLDGVLVAAGLPQGADPSRSMHRSGDRGRILTEMAVAVNRWAEENSRHVVAELAIEMPQAYDSNGQKGDQNDLIHLAAVVGAVCAMFSYAPTRVYLPREWKGQVPKALHHARAMKRLTAGEVSAIPLRPRAKTPDHNTMDAVALGLTHLRRMG